MKRRLPLLASTIATAALLAAGCGGDDEETTTTSGATGASGASGSSGPLDRATFIDEADEICRTEEADLNDELELVAPGGLENASSDQVDEAVTDVIVPSLKAQLDQIRELSPPDGDEQRVDAIASALEDGIKELEQDPGILATTGSDSLDKANKLAMDYGLEDCGG